MARITMFLPGDYRPVPNSLAEPNVRDVRRGDDEGGDPPRASDAPDRQVPRRRRATRSSALSGIDDPMIGVYSHWVYGPHTTDGVVGTDNPLLLASNFDGTWPGLVGLLNTGACLTSLGRKHSRLWSEKADLTTDDAFMARLDAWVRTGTIEYDDGCIRRTPRARRIGDRRQDRRRHEGEAAVADDARRYVDGNDQRLLRSATPRQSRLLRTQGRSGVDHRAGQAGQGGTHRRRAGLRETTKASSSTTATTSPKKRRAANCAATARCSIFSRNSAPIASAGSTSSDSSVRCRRRTSPRVC